jgi:hypothetical protein
MNRSEINKIVKERVGLKPQKGYDSIYEYATVSNRSRTPGLIWPCLRCNGYGRIYDPNDPPCPIEGNKMCDRITCTKCGGNGESTRKEWAERWKEYLKEYKKRVDQWRHEKSTLSAILSKLTTEEYELLRDLII